MGTGPLDPRRWSRPVRGAAICLVIAACIYCTGQVLARRASSRGALRARIVASLQERLGPVELGPEVQVDPLFRVRCGPLELPGLLPTDPPLLRIESIRIVPDLLASVRARRPVPASIRLSGVRIDLPERPSTLHQILDRLGPRRMAQGRAAGSGEAVDGPSVRVRDLTVAFALGGHRLTAGPIQATLSRRREASGRSWASADLRFPGSGQGTVSLRGDGQGWQVTARLERIDPRALPAELSSLAARWSGGTVSILVSGDASPAFAQARARVELAAADLRLAGTGLAAEPLGPLDVRFAGDLDWTAADRRIRLAHGSLALPGGAAVALEAGLELRKGLPFTLDARAGAVDFLRTLSALPEALSLPPEAPHPSGTLDASATLAGPLVDPAAWRVDASLDLSRMREAARRDAPVALLRPFVQRAQPEPGPAHTFLVGPANPGFVPVAELPRYVVRAVTASEDAGFFGHSGFDFEELRNAVIEGAEAGHLVRGGSTITQQLAKNLYLSREKTLARKLREALITIALEATVPKQRLMEIYLNVAEWGPGLWGIGPAARHWFGRDARELTPREAAFLATVIPNPVRYHYMWTRGSLSEAWQQRVDDLLRTMKGQGTITDEELQAALEEPIVFANAGASGSPADAGPGELRPGDAASTRGGAGRRGRSLLR